MIEIFKDIVANNNNQICKKSCLISQTSTLRALLQLVSISMIEVAKSDIPEQEFDLSNYLERFNQPSDGLPIEIINLLVPSIRSYIDSSLCWGWFKDSGVRENQLSEALTSWVKFRNDTTGHGVLDDISVEEWHPKTEQLIYRTLTTFSDFIPTIDNENLYLKSSKISHRILNTPVIRKKNPIVIKSIKCKKGSWILNGQILSDINAETYKVYLDEDNIFSLNESPLVQ